jgi:hypothetical protein
LGVDSRFACPQLYQVHFPYTFLSTEQRFSGLTAFLLPRHRPYDNVRLDLNVPDEDEFAMCVLGCMTPYLTGVFPRRADYYDRFLTFRNASPQAVERWKSSLRLFFQKLMFRHGKPLVVKSPPHTGRIKLLLELFPEAKFVHIHRNPFTVFQSSVHTYTNALPYGRLQRTGGIDWTERIIRQYKELYDAFFAERGLIGAGRYHEICFEELERDPVAEIQRLYSALGLPSFAEVELSLRAYLDSQSSYRKNEFRELAPDFRQRIAREWKRCFDEWEYPV